MPGAIQLSDARQPRYAAGSLNATNSLTNGLVCAIHWGNQHRAVHNAARRTRGGSITPGIVGSNAHMRHWGGLSGIGWSTAANAQYITACHENDLGLAGTTVYLLQRHTDTTLRISAGFGVFDGGTLTRRCGATTPYSDGNVYWDYGGAAGGQRLTWTGLGGKSVNRLNRWCFVAAPRGLEIWFQGILRNSNTTAASRTTAADDKFMINNGETNSVVANDIAEIYLFLVWNRGLSQGEIRLLDADPWQVFSTRDIQRSFVPAAATTPPVIEAANCTVSGSNTASGSWAVSHPAASAGDLLIFNVGWDNSTDVPTVTAPSGPNGETLTSIEGPIASSGTEVRGQAWYTVATGSWSASTVTFTPSANESWSATVIRIAAGGFDATRPIGANSSVASAASESAVDSPAFTAGSSDGNGKLVWFAIVDTDPLSGTNPTGCTILQTQDLGAVAHGIAVRDAAVTNSESIAAITDWAIAGDTWASIAYVVRPSLVAASAYNAVPLLDHYYRMTGVQ